MTLRIVLLFLLLCSSACLTSPAEEKETNYGKVVSIADGDTFTMLLDNQRTLRVRLVGIDCPERYQPYSNVARQFLSDAIFGKEVMVVVDSEDQYGRALGWVFHDDKNIKQELLKAGLAWRYKRYSKDRELQALEDQARKQKMGLWQDKDPIPPWDWRRGVRD